MERFNSFKMIHKGLRAMLFDCALTLQQTYFPDIEESAIAIQKVKDVVFLFERHGKNEDQMVMPAIKHAAPEMVDAYEKEHIEDHALGNKLINLINMFLHTETDEEKIIAGSALSKAFTDFMLFNLEHMAKEEMEINPVLWKLYSDAELIAINAQIAEGLPEDEKELCTKWMMMGVNKQEAKDWMKTIKNTDPGFVYDRLYEPGNIYLPVRSRKEAQKGLAGRATILTFSGVMG